MTADALGRPLRFVLTAGQGNNSTQADHLLEGVQTECVIVERGYDSEKILKEIEELGALALAHPTHTVPSPRR